MAILSIQSHVAYGYVGNKAAVFPLQVMGYDVWPVNTVQFSNNTGYGKWEGEVFSRSHINAIIRGIENLGVVGNCRAILSGYMGSKDICCEVAATVKRFKEKNKNIIYLCDPVMGKVNCFVKPEVLEFFKEDLHADIITPSQLEAEILSEIKIEDHDTIKEAANYFFNLGVKVVVITGVKFKNMVRDNCVFVAYDSKYFMVKSKEYEYDCPPNGTGDLLSALFLGFYLATGDGSESLRRTIYFMEQVMNNTFRARSRELLVTSVNYSLFEEKYLPKTVEI